MTSDPISSSGRLRGGRLVRSVAPLVWRLARGMTLGVRAVVLERGSVLLVRHGYTEGWHFPGGGVEPGETASAALVRELREETGMVATSAPRLHGLFFNPKVGGRDHVAVYVVGDFIRAAEPPFGREIVAREFFPVDALPAGATPATRRRLAEILGGEPAGELW